MFSHSGGLAGYNTFINVFPDFKMGFIVFSNIGDFNANAKAYEMVDLFIKDTIVKKEEVKKLQRDSLTAILKDTVPLKKYIGSYICEEGLPFNFDIKNNKLYYHLYTESNFLIQDSINSFSIPNAPNVKFLFSVQKMDTTVDIITADQIYHLKKYIKYTSQSDQILKTYTGSYYCPELDCKYGIVLKDHNLLLTNSKYNDTKLTLVNSNHLLTGYWWINHLNMLRGRKKNIIGFEINSGSIMHLRFNKIE